ncbi:MAG: DUF1385 domain-containing protein [Actinomycetota bacterium]
MASKPSIGGQALIEGVMMRGPTSWAIAVRKTDSEIATETHPLPGHSERHKWLKWPLVRGVYVLVESLTIGLKALMISANYSLEEKDRLSEKQLGWTMAGALVFFTGIFILLPALATKFGGRLIGVESELVQNIVEGLFRIGLFVGYLLLISMLRDIRRVFQYHGAEHKTIYAYENDDPMDPEVVDRYSTLHVRCGTNFLFIVLALTIVVHFIMDITLPESIPLRVSARILAIPFLAGIAYEVIRAAGKRGDSLVFRIASLPGLALQRITTRPPDRNQIEVAIAAMESVIAREKLAEPAKEAEAAQPSPAVLPQTEAGPAAT